jgi:hypothetical protein
VYLQLGEAIFGSMSTGYELRPVHDKERDVAHTTTVCASCGGSYANDTIRRSLHFKQSTFTLELIGGQQEWKAEESFMSLQGTIYS